MFAEPTVSLLVGSSVSGPGWTSWAVFQSWLCHPAASWDTWHGIFSFPEHMKKKKKLENSRKLVCSELFLAGSARSWPTMKAACLSADGGLTRQCFDFTRAREHAKPDQSHITPLLKITFPKLRILAVCCFPLTLSWRVTEGWINLLRDKTKECVVRQSVEKRSVLEFCL